MAITWENNGSYQDLSSLALNSLWPTSQAAGNMTSDAKEAMTAPGSEPVDPLPDRDHQGDPTVKLGAKTPPGTDGKPQASGQSGGPSYPEPSWKPTTKPQVVRRS